MLHGLPGFELVACPLCGARGEEELLTAPDWQAPTGPLYRVVRCAECDMGYQNPRPTRAIVGQFYPDNYEPYAARKSRSNGRSLKERLERQVLTSTLSYPAVPAAWFEKVLAKLVTPWLRPSADSQAAIPFLGEGKLLEVGCGSGWFAQRMQERGWNVTVLDISGPMVQRIRSELGMQGFVGELPHPELKPASFDVVNMGALLEHVHDPHAVIASATQVLRPGGLLVISVPNRASWGFQYFGVDWWPLELPRHLLYFTPHTLQRLLEAHGLVVTSLRQLGRTGWMRRSLQFAARRSGWARIAQRGWFPGWLTRWTVQRGAGDCLLVVARKPTTAALPRAA